MSTSQDVGVRVGFSLSAMFGKLSESLDDMRGHLVGIGQTLDAFHKFATQNPRQSPIVRPLRGVVTVDATPSTYMLLDLGGPTSGRVWDLRRISVVRTTVAATGIASDVFSAVASTIVGLAVTNKAVLNAGVSNVTGIDDWIVLASAANNPLSQTWSAHEATIRFGQRFVVVIKGGLASDQWSAFGQAEEWIESQPEEIVA